MRMDQCLWVLGCSHVQSQFISDIISTNMYNGITGLAAAMCACMYVGGGGVHVFMHVNGCGCGGASSPATIDKTISTNAQ